MKPLLEAKKVPMTNGLIKGEDYKSKFPATWTTKRSHHTQSKDHDIRQIQKFTPFDNTDFNNIDFDVKTGSYGPLKNDNYYEDLKKRDAYRSAFDRNQDYERDFSHIATKLAAFDFKDQEGLEELKFAAAHVLENSVNWRKPKSMGKTLKETCYH